MLSNTTISSWLWLMGCMAATVVLYFSGLDGGYYFDDAHVIQQNSAIRIENLSSFSLLQAAYSFSAGGRELSMLTFALNHYFFGDSTWWYKFINLCIHCLNGVGVFLLCRALVGLAGARDSYSQKATIQNYIPLMVTTLWLVHPINLIPVLYISQRMTLLSSMFVVYGLVAYIWVRLNIQSPSRKLVYLPLVIAFFTLLGFKCKENAILLPGFAFIIELTLLRFMDRRQSIDKIVITMFSLGAFLILTYVVYKFYNDPNWIAGGYKRRYFSLDERVMTQFRALMFYLSQIAAPSITQLSLWHDDFTLSTSLLSPKTTLYSLIGLLVIVVGGLATVSRFPLFSLGILWFFVAHAIESSIFSLELIHEHRNYLASFGIVLLIGVIIARLPIPPVGYFIVSLSLVCSFSWVLYQRGQIWGDEFVHAEFEASNHPESASAVFNLGVKYYQSAMAGDDEAVKFAYPLILKTAENDPHSIIPELLLVIFSEHQAVNYQATWLETATKKIRQYPYMAPSKLALQRLYECLKDDRCHPPVSDVEQLFDAALESQDENLLTTVGFYFTEVNVDHNRAKKAFKKALRNKAANWVNYLSFLLHAGETQIVCKEYWRLDRKRSQGEIANEIHFIEQLNYLDQQLEQCGTDKSD